MEVRIRLSSAIARYAPTPVVTLALPSGATVQDIYDRLGAGNPQLGAALRCALPIVAGVHVERGQTLAHGDEVALLAPASGG
jgi:molybdopterin converting factor small subunit